jgi:hypothetical protein
MCSGRVTQRVTLQPVTRRIAQAVLDGGPITGTFEEGAWHDRIPGAHERGHPRH